MDMTSRSSNALLDRAQADIAQLLRRFENVVALAPVEVKVNDPSQGDGEGREGGKMVGKDRNTTAVEAYQIEVETVALVRAAEDMLSLTRSLKEAWLFGTLDTISDGAVRQKTEEDASVVGRGVERIIKRAE